MRITITAIAILVVMAGCQSTSDQMLAAGYDPSYVAGFSQGESSGKNAAGHPYMAFIKDTHRYEADSQYRQGWDDGYSRGKSQYESIRRGGW